MTRLEKIKNEIERLKEALHDWFEAGSIWEKKQKESIEQRQFAGLTMMEKEQEKPKWDDSDMRYDEGELLSRFAFYTYKDEPDVLYLSNVFVEETFRNIGIGTKILTAAEKVAETLGATSIRLKVKQGSPANAWYRKRGYGYTTFEDGYDWLEKVLEYNKPVPKIESYVAKYFAGSWPGSETAEQCNTHMTFTPPTILRLAEYFYTLGKQEQSKEDLPKIKGWVARDKSGELNLFYEEPRRSNAAFEDWFPRDSIAFNLPRDFFSDIKWESNPIEVELLIRKI